MRGRGLNYLARGVYLEDPTETTFYIKIILGKLMHTPYLYNMKHCGIYQIKNTVTGKLYIGCSVDFYKRKSRHLANLRYNKNKNKNLLADYILYGESAFEFSMLEYCDKSVLEEREIYWIKQLDSSNPLVGYNIFLGGKNGKMCDHYSKPKVLKKYVNYYIKKKPEDIIPYSERNIKRQDITLEHSVTNEILNFKSIAECIKVLNMVPNKVHKCLNNSYKKYTHRGYWFKKV